MATSLKDVQFSQQGEKVDAPKTESSFSFPTSLTPEPTATQMYVIFRLVKKKQRRLRIDGICDGVINPKTKRRERIWLLRGADSIWQSELVEQLKDKDYVKNNRISLLFEDGICRIPVNEDRQLEFARLNIHNVGKNRNGSGKYDYYEYDAGEEQKLRLDKQMSKINTVLKVKDMAVEPMKKLSLFLGITPYDELGQLKGDDGMRTELLLKADAQPEIVNKYIDSKEVEIAYMVRKAIIEAKIDLTGQQGNAIWAGGKGFIGKIPSSRKAYEYLTELAMTNSDDGKAFKEQLEQMIT
jgi:hypothetical protein